MKRALLFVPVRQELHRRGQPQDPRGDTEGEVATQLDQLQVYCHERQYEVVGVVHTIAVVEEMFNRDQADVLILISREVLPFKVETVASATWTPPRQPPNLPGQRGRSHLPRRHRRPRRLQ